MSEQTSLGNKGYGFLFQDTPPKDCFSPEDLTSDHRQFAEVAEAFIRQDLDPIDQDLEKTDRDLLANTLKKAGAAGLLMIEIPEEYGGLGLDLTSQMVVVERMGRTGGFAVAMGVQTGIGMEPILFFGNDEQKARYLPLLASGEWIGAYALTEPGSGSDALAARTSATLSSCGKYYVLNGSKIYISNGGVADLFTLFAKVDGDKFTAFLIEKGIPGLVVGGEEEKMGIKSSSTTPLTLQDVRVPVENILGQVGQGHKIALNILNIGRLKLGMGTIGAMKDVLNRTIPYAIQRKQFGARLVDFPLIQQKLAAMVTATFASESIAYRATGQIDYEIKTTASTGLPTFVQQLAALSEFSAECAINKVFDSESLNLVADEGIQIHGGYGYCQEYRVERTYRDSRINRIFEGTNEINRLYIGGNLLKRSMKGDLPLMKAITETQQAVLKPAQTPSSEDDLNKVKTILVNGRQQFFLVTGMIVQKFLPDLERLTHEQEILANLADVLIQLYVLESCYLRSAKIRMSDVSKNNLHCLVSVYQAYRSAEVIDQKIRELVDGLFEGETRNTHRAVLRKFSHHPHINPVQLGRQIAAEAIQAEGYPLGNP